MRSEAKTSSAASIVATAALVAAGCALGASAGILARFPGLGAAILFLPYAVVTAALLRTARRHWWIILLAAAAGDFLPHWRSGESLTFVLLAEIVNDGRAIIAALGITRWARRSGRFESMREMVAYLAVAVLVAPAVAALGGAGLVSWFGTAPGFWLVWQQWWLSNAITGLIVLPLLTFDVRALLSRGVRPSAARAAEAALLVISLLVVGAAVFARSYDRSPTHQAHLYWALPFLLWAAVRFGPRGTCAALMGVTSLSVWGAIAGRGPFAPDAATENLLELQVFLLAVSIPVLLLSALIEQQRRTAAALTEIEKRKSVEAALRESNRRKDEFLAMLGHELRNPLAPISIALQILREAPPASRDAAWARESIGRQLSHMTRLLDDLLDISRVTLGKIQLQLAPVSVGQVIASAVEATRPLIDSGAHQLTVKLPDDSVMIRGDAVRLTQVVANLINNAAKYTERGGRIDVAVDHDGAEVRVSVRDNGIGIAADALERIFDLFSQLPGGHERAQGGLGIGLTLARRLVEMHGGSVEARSEGPNRGTEIVVRLPLAALEPTPRPAVQAPAAEENQPASLRILAVDDNVHMAQGLASILRMWGHNVRTAHDGAAALEVATQFAPEVVLLDLSLPRVDGLEVARRLRQAPEHTPSLLVSMSGFGQEDTRRHSGEAGFHHHLTKPFDMRALRAMLDDCMRSKNSVST
jgi:signal transduction histidine kinase/CheY-like chemotaxis protein